MAPTYIHSPESARRPPLGKVFTKTTELLGSTQNEIKLLVVSCTLGALSSLGYTKIIPQWDGFPIYLHTLIIISERKCHSPLHSTLLDP